MQEVKKYFALIQIDIKDSVERVAHDVPSIIHLFSSGGKHPPETLFYADRGSVFGVLFQSDRPAAVLRTNFDRAGCTRNTDKIFIMEVGEDVSAKGNSRAGNWLQHH